MKTLTATYVEVSELFASLGFDELAIDYWCCNPRFSFQDVDLPLVRMDGFLLALEGIPIDETAAFIAAVKNRPGYDPYLYVDIEN